MGKANVTIAISGTYNGRAIEQAQRELEKMHITAVSECGGVGEEFVKLGSKAADLGGAIHNAGYKMEQFGYDATAYITVPILAAATACGTAAIEIDDALTGVRKTVDGTEQDFEELKDAAIEFSETNAIDATQILYAEELGGQLGYAKDELSEFARVATGLNLSTSMELETAATEMAQFANITGMAHDQTSNYGSAIVELGNNVASTESDISSMALRLAAAGSQVGMSQSEILGLSAALTSMGLTAEAGGNAMSTVISKIDKDVALSTENVETWADAAGMTATEFADAWRNDPVDALAKLLSGMEAASDEGSSMAVILDELGVSSIRQTDALKRLASNSELVADTVQMANDAWEDNTALQREVDKRNQSMSSRFKILQNRVTAVAEEVGSPLIDALLEFLDTANPAIEFIADMAQSFADADEQDQQFALGLAATVTAIGPVTTVAGKLTQGIGNVVTGFGTASQKVGTFFHGLQDAADACGGYEELAKGIRDKTLDLGDAAFDANGKISNAASSVQTLQSVMNTMNFAIAAAVITDLIGQFADLVEHEQLVVDGTYGLETALGKAADAYGSYSGEIAESTQSVISSVEDSLKRQQELAQTAQDTWADYGTNAAKVDYYADVIDRLRDKTSLTKDEQLQLKNAVEQYNDITGGSLQIIDDQTGKLNLNKDAINATTEAYKRQAVAQAAYELYKQIIEENVQKTVELEKANRALTDAVEEDSKTFGDWGTISVDSLRRISGTANGEIGELTGLINDLEEEIATNEQVAAEYLKLIEGSTTSFDTLQDALDETGTSWEDFGFTAKDQFTAMQTNFDGTLESIIRSCNDQGLQIPQTLADAINKTSSKAEDSAEGLGTAVDEGIAKGLEDNADKPKSGLEKIWEDLSNAWCDFWGISSPSRRMEDYGRDMDLGLENGLEDNQSGPQSAMDAIGNLMQDAIEGLPSWMKQLGKDAGSNLSSGISSMSGSVKSSANTLNTSAQNGLNSVTNSFKTTGTKAASSFSNAISSSSAYSSGQSIANTARSGMGSVSATQTGKNFAYGFSNGMGSIDIWSAAYNVGLSALGAIKSALGIASPSKETIAVGEYFGEGAVIGMKRTESAISAESRRLSNAMFLDPSYGDAYNGSRYYDSMQSTTTNQQFTMNVVINMTGTDTKQAAAAGKAAGDALYTEFVRKLRS